VQDDPELITAEARDDIVRAQRGANARGDDPQESVPCFMTQRIIDWLEVVDTTNPLSVRTADTHNPKPTRRKATAVFGAMRLGCGSTGVFSLSEKMS
jgi:hypothetical protein